MSAKDGIHIQYQHETSGFSTVTNAAVYNPTPQSGFYYSVSDLHTTLRYMTGNLSLVMDRTGNLLLKTRELVYLLMPRRARKVTVEAQVKKPTKPRKTKKQDKAA